MLLDSLVEAGIQSVAPGLLSGVSQLDALGVGSSNSLSIVGDRWADGPSRNTPLVPQNNNGGY